MTSNVLCRYYQQGACAFGDKCRFSHNKQQDEPSQVCKYYLAGNCAYGDKCRYQHTKPGWSSRGQPAPPSNYNAPSGVHKPPVGSAAANMVKLPSGASEFGLVEAAPNWDDYMTPDEMDEFEQWQAEQAMAGAGHGGNSQAQDGDDGDIMDPADIPLCNEYAATGDCSAGDDCCYIHGEQCEICGYFCIHPYNPDITAHHQLVCAEAMAAAAAGQGTDNNNANKTASCNGSAAAAAAAPKAVSGDAADQKGEEEADGAAADVADDSRQVEFSDTVAGSTLQESEADDEVDSSAAPAAGAGKGAKPADKKAEAAAAAADKLAEQLAEAKVSS